MPRSTARTNCLLELRASPKLCSQHNAAASSAALPYAPRKNVLAMMQYAVCHELGVLAKVHWSEMGSRIKTMPAKSRTDGLFHSYNK